MTTEKQRILSGFSESEYEGLKFFFLMLMGYISKNVRCISDLISDLLRKLHRPVILA